MAKYKITLRRENAEIAISITELETGNIIYKNGFFSSVNYKQDKQFNELVEMFIKYEKDSIIQFRNETRYYDLLLNLYGARVIELKKFDIDDKLNIVKLHGGIL